MALDAKELAKEKELNRELSDAEMDRLLIPRRSVGTWATFGLILVGLVGGAGWLFGARILNAGRNYAAEVAAVGTPEQRRQAQEVIQHVNSRLTLWKLQHQGRLPSFEGHPGWEQFTQTTDISGRLSPTRGVPVCGPYLATKPVNPINEMSTVYTVEGEPVLGQPLPDGAKAGFVYSKSAARLWITDVAGTRPFDPAAVYEITSPAPARAAAPARSGGTTEGAAEKEPATAETPAATPEKTPVAPAKPAVTPAPTRAPEPKATATTPAPAKTGQTTTTPAKSPAPAGGQPKAKK